MYTNARMSFLASGVTTADLLHLFKAVDVVVERGQRVAGTEPDVYVPFAFPLEEGVLLPPPLRAKAKS
ncbi:MAG TPA: hypothetical protein VGX23_04560 [Actinocrinis sp.]|nr:hypothetical protein [Actinocrinis sp.]